MASTLVQKPDGTYQYQTLQQQTLVNNSPFVIDEEGTHFALPTNQTGDFLLAVSEGPHVLSKCAFSVVGESEALLPKNAELGVKLNKSVYQPGETIEMQITAPYKGAGLISIERDKVYVYRWFQADSTGSMHTIDLPQDFQGHGYVNIAFIRDWNSKNSSLIP